MDFIPNTDEERREMLKAIGVKSFKELIEDIPSSLRKADIDTPEGLSEMELFRHLRSLSKKNINADDYPTYLGAGAYDHFIPAAVDYLSSRGEFVTAYTPYQAEASQGLLQTIYEFQTAICELMGMDVANASLYDAASACAEAALLAIRHTNRKKIIVSRTLNPQYRTVIETYLKNMVSIIEVSGNEGITDVSKLKASLDDDTAAFIVQNPNFFGCLEDMTVFETICHRQGALFIVCTNPIALGVLKPPGEYNADIACAEGQSLGLPLSYGGPYLGIFAGKKEFIRKIPGRVVGETMDLQGNRAFTLTLQTREQHIRRERATSNICTNQALCALRALIFVSLLGKEGLKETGLKNIKLSHYAYEKVLEINGFAPAFDQPFFNEFVISSKKSPEIIQDALLKDGIIGGLPLKRYYPELAEATLWCVTETKTEEDIGKLMEVLRRV